MAHALKLVTNQEPALGSAVGTTLDAWSELLHELGEPRYRARQVFRWIHERGELEPSRMTDLPAGLRSDLERAVAWRPFEVEQVSRSVDGTRKLLLSARDGKRIECVLIPMGKRSVRSPSRAEGAPPDERERITLCVSTQVGCAMGCVFCASGRSGLRRGLDAGEIVAQALIARRYLGPDEYLRNVVFMGMGEPLHHYDQTVRAIRLLTHPDGLNIGLRRITVSTVGLVPAIRRLAHDFQGKVGLAISLHAPSDELRTRLIPINARYPLAELIAELEAYPLPPRRRITIEYTLIAGVNDSPACADELALLLAGLRVKVNLIPMNPVDGSGLETSSEASVERFHERLAAKRVSCSVRARKGDDVDAACGQLALRG